MFTGPRYYPLIECDSEGKDAMPMFPSDRESNVSNNNGFYLEEAVPGYYHLKTGYGRNSAGKATVIHCPQCRKPMKRVTANRDAYKGTVLYVCTGCND